MKGPFTQCHAQETIPTTRMNWENCSVLGALWAHQPQRGSWHGFTVEGSDRGNSGSLLPGHSPSWLQAPGQALFLCSILDLSTNLA